MQRKEYIRYISLLITHPDIHVLNLEEGETIKANINKLAEFFNNPNYKSPFEILMNDRQLNALKRHGIHRFEDTFYTVRHPNTLNKWREKVQNMGLLKKHEVIEVAISLFNRYRNETGDSDDDDEDYVDLASEEEESVMEVEEDSADEFVKLYQAAMSSGTASNKAAAEAAMNKRLSKFT